MTAWLDDLSRMTRVLSVVAADDEIVRTGKQTFLIGGHGPAIASIWAVKRALDPAGPFDPGKTLDAA